MPDDEQRSLGVLEGAMMAIQREVALFREDFRDHVADEYRRMAETDRKIDVALSFQNKVVGGLRVSRAIWGIWVAVVSAAIGILGLFRTQ